MAVFEKSYEVPEEWVEPLYNHVHHSNALRILERARLDYLEEIGFPDADFIAKKQFLVISRIEVNYKRELLGEPVVVTCERVRVNKKEILIEQRIMNGKGKVAVEALIVSTLLCGVRKRSMLPPEEFRRALCGGG